MTEDKMVGRLNDDRIMSRYIDFLIKLAPTVADPDAILDRIELAMLTRSQLESDLDALAEVPCEVC